MGNDYDVVDFYPFIGFLHSMHVWQLQNYWAVRFLKEHCRSHLRDYAWRYGECVGAQLKQILLVDDFTAWRQFIETLLSVTPEWKLCGEAINGADALVKAEELQPDLVLLDLDLPDITGIEVARRLQLRIPTTKVIFLSADPSPHLVNAALDAGASGYLLKSQLVAELLPALKEVFAGNRFISSGIDF